jgi:Zn-dependent peptidase ImmA (M78 family)/predicted secreted protein
MTTWRERRDGRNRGSLAAMRAMARMEQDPAEPVDVFSVIENDRVWLMFQPLDNLYGFYDREGDTAGIAINSGHPLSLQRFTAAHEYGHHRLRHARSVDGAEDINGSGPDLPVQEVEAQAFAADFLMPPQLVNRAISRLSLSSTPTAMDIYQLSLEIGSSYRATISQLHNMHLIDDPLAEELRRLKPIDLKVELSGGERPENSRADVWLLTDGLVSRQLYLRLGDEVHLRLPEIPTGGYRWHWEVEGGAEGMELLADGYEQRSALAAGRIGARRNRHLWLRATAPARGHLKARLTRSWEGDQSQALDEIRVPLRVMEPRSGGEGVGVSRRQRRLPLQAA